MTATASTPWNEKSTRIVTVAFFNENGYEVVPISASYSIMDVRTRTVIVASTPLTGLGFTVDVVVTAAQNTIITPGVTEEKHVLTVEYTYGAPVKDGKDDYYFTIRNMPGVS